MDAQIVIDRVRDLLVTLENELIDEPDPEPTVVFSASPASIEPGQDVTLSWSTEHADLRTASGGWSGEKAASATEVVTPTADTVYTLTCTGDGGSVTKNVIVSVAAEDEEPEPPIPGELAESELGKAAIALSKGEFSAILFGGYPAQNAWGNAARGLIDFFNGYYRPAEGEPYQPGLRRAPATLEWTDRFHWCPQRRLLISQGLRQANRLLTYHVDTHEWREYRLDKENAPDVYEKFGHLYARTAYDASRGHFYRLFGDVVCRWIVDEDRWEQFGGAPDGGKVPIEWFPDIDRLIMLARGEIHGWDGVEWQTYGTCTVDGYHASSRYSPTRGEIMFIGGNATPNSVAIINKAGAIRTCSPIPQTHNISNANLVADPVSGNWLAELSNADNSKRMLYEYSPVMDEWRIQAEWAYPVGDYPLQRYGRHVVVDIPELQCLVWCLSNDGLRLHKPQSVFGAAEQPEDQPDVEEPDPSDPDDPPPEDQPDDPPVTEPPIQSDTLLMDAAADMQPGEWRHIATDTGGKSFKSFQSVQRIDDAAGGGADGIGWTQNMVLADGRLMLMLMRSNHLNRALMVMEPNGRWWRINEPPGFDTGGRRPFNRLTQDDAYLYFAPKDAKVKMGYFIRTPLDVQEGAVVFERYGVSIGDDQMDTVGNFAMTYVPEWGRFYAYTPGGKVWTWTHGETVWTRTGRAPGTGYAGLLLWNPVKEELIITGGQTFGGAPSLSHKVGRMTEPFGEVEELDDMRRPDGSLMGYSAAYSKMIVDPRDGSYLMIDGDRHIYRNETAGGTYSSVYDDLNDMLPFGRYEHYAPYAHLTDETIVFVSHIAGVVLHRLR